MRYVGLLTLVFSDVLIARGQLRRFDLSNFKDRIAQHLRRAGLGRLQTVGGIDFSLTAWTKQGVTAWQPHLHAMVWCQMGIEETAQILREHTRTSALVGEPVNLTPVTGDLPSVAGYTLKAYFEKRVPYMSEQTGEYRVRHLPLGEPSAMANLAAWYLAKRNQYDPSLALPWAQKSADAGNLSGAHILGAMYEGGLGVTKNFDEAKRWYEKAGQEAVPELNRLENAKRQATEEQKQTSERQAQLAAQEQQRIEYARSAKEGSEREAAAQAAAQAEATKRLLRWQEYQAREKTLIEKVLNYSSTALEEGTAEDYWVIDQNDKCSAVRQYPVGELVVNIRKFNIRGFRYSPEFFGDETQRFMTFARDQRMERLEKAWALAFQECPGKKSDF
jgi:Sel1 repeat